MVRGRSAYTRVRDFALSSTGQKIARHVGAAVGDAALRYGKEQVKAYVNRVAARGAKRAAPVPEERVVMKRARVNRGGRRVGVVRGRQGRRFGKPLKKRVPRYATMGYVLEYEHGQTDTSPQAVYAAHGVGNASLLIGVCAAITRRALKRFGMTLKSWQQGAVTGDADDKFQWTIQTKNAPNGGVSNHQSSIVTGTGFGITMATDLADLMMAQYTASRVYWEVVEVRLVWTKVVGANPTQWREEYRRMASDLYFDIYIKSVLSVQNRTPAATGTADETNALDVAANPLVGRIYQGNGTEISFVAQDGGGSNTFLTLDKYYGFDTKGSHVTSGAGLIGKAPPHTAFSNCYASRMVMLAPGEIRDDVLVIKKKMSFNQFIYKMSNYLRNSSTVALSTNESQIWMPYRMIGLERKLDTRSNEPDVSLGLETNFKLMIYCSDRTKTAPVRHLVQTT